MKKWSEIRQGIINKLFMDEAEVNSENENYASKFAYFANECLNQIANSVKPRIATFDFDVCSKLFVGKYFELKNPVIYYKQTGIPPIDGKIELTLGELKQFYDAEGNLWETDGTYLKQLPSDAPTVDLVEWIFGTNFRLIPFRIQYDDEKWVLPEKDVLYYTGTKSYIYTNNELKVVNNVFYIGHTIQMPDDFLSFADMINYKDNVEYSNITYVTDKIIKVDSVGTYKIFYNALWEPITEDYMNDQEQLDLPIDQSVLNCIPTYVAAQILAEDDVQRSTILKNEYELMLSRLDTNILYQENHYKSTGGWY